MSIARKRGICPDCLPGSPETILIAGRCQRHYWASRAAGQKFFGKKAVDNPILQKPDNNIVTAKAKTGVLTLEQIIDENSGGYNPNSQIVDTQNLKNWFAYQIYRSETELFWVCENCKEPIYLMGDQSRKSCQAHILPKRDFHSVKFNIYNHMLLGGLFSDCSCHYKYDNSWLKAEKMPVFRLAISRFFLFKSILTKQEVLKLPEPFIKYV